MIGLFLALVSFFGFASAQGLNDGTNYPLKKGKASDPLYGNRPARTLSQREYSQLFKSQVVQPALEAGFGAIALNLQTGEISICEKAPKPSSLSLLLVSGLTFLLRKRQRG